MNNGNGSTDAVSPVVQQAKCAFVAEPTPTNLLLAEIAERGNLKRAFQSVKRNKGAAGIDNISIQEVEQHLKAILEETAKALRNGGYQPQPVRHQAILKPDGTPRHLGIPTVVDRLVQQAMVQVLTPLIDPTFSDQSYGFRPKRSAKDAVQKASQFVAEGKIWVVDIDLEHFFDTVNHDKLMSLLAKRIEDKALLRLIRRFLTAGGKMGWHGRQREEHHKVGHCRPCSPISCFTNSTPSSPDESTASAGMPTIATSTCDPKRPPTGYFAPSPLGSRSA